MKIFTILFGLLLVSSVSFAVTDVEIKISGAKAKQLFMSMLIASESGNSLYPEVEGAAGFQLAEGPHLQCKVNSEMLIQYGSFTKIPSSNFDCYYGDNF